MTARRDEGATPADIPLRLTEAARIAFPGSGLTAAALRREHARGRLEIFRIGGKDFTTLDAINRMKAACRVEAKAPTSISGNGAAGMGSGSSVMAKAKSAQASAMMAAEGLI